MGAKIRNAQMGKIPYMLVVGDRELEAGEVNVRLRDESRRGAMNVNDVIEMIQSAVDERRVL